MNKPFETLPETTVTIRVDPAASVASIREALTRIFTTEQVCVTEAPADQTAEIAAVRDGEVVATSPAAALLESLLLVNSDVYITGSRALEDAGLPAVLWALHEIPFQLRGYPDSDSEKLLLIAVSRAIERRATGCHRCRRSCLRRRRCQRARRAGCDRPHRRERATPPRLVCRLRAGEYRRRADRAVCPRPWRKPLGWVLDVYPRSHPIDRSDDHRAGGGGIILRAPVAGGGEI